MGSKCTWGWQPTSSGWPVRLSLCACVCVCVKRGGGLCLPAPSPHRFTLHVLVLALAPPQLMRLPASAASLPPPPSPLPCSPPQARVFAPAPAGCRRCIVATNIAETSVTGERWGGGWAMIVVGWGGGGQWTVNGWGVADAAAVPHLLPGFPVASSRSYVCCCASACVTSVHRLCAQWMAWCMWWTQAWSSKRSTTLAQVGAWLHAQCRSAACDLAGNTQVHSEHACACVPAVAGNALVLLCQCRSPGM